MTSTYGLTEAQTRTMLEYLFSYPDADFLEKVELRNWIKSGNNPYTNDNGLVDDDGHPIDFIGAIRVWDGLASEYSRNPQEFHKRYLAGRTVIHLSDLPEKNSS